MSEELDDHEVKTQADTGLYLAEAMFPGEKLPDYGGITTKKETKHYAAVRSSTELGKKVIAVIEKLKKLQTEYYIKKDEYILETNNNVEDNFDNYVEGLLEIKELQKTDFKIFVRKLRIARKKYFKKKIRFDLDIKTKKQLARDRYEADAHKLKLEIDRDTLMTYDDHVTHQLTIGVSVKGHGRNEVSNIQMSHRSGNPAPVHTRSRMDKLLNRNKEPKIGERTDVK